MDDFDRAEQEISEQCGNGEISIGEYNKAMRDLQRDYLEEAREAAQRAYENELDRNNP